jgi:hypothetical protein
MLIQRCHIQHDDTKHKGICHNQILHKKAQHKAISIWLLSMSSLLVMTDTIMILGKMAFGITTLYKKWLKRIHLLLLNLSFY